CLSDWSSDVCSSDLTLELAQDGVDQRLVQAQHPLALLPRLRAEPLRVSAEAGEDDGEVARAHLCKLRSARATCTYVRAAAIYVSTTGPRVRWATTSTQDVAPSR